MRTEQKEIDRRVKEQCPELIGRGVYRKEEDTSK